MQTFTAKPTEPATVQAVQYLAQGEDGPGNVDEILEELGASAARQVPWNPEGGQHSLIVASPDGSTVLATDGDYIVLHEGGSASVLSADEFAEAYDAPKFATGGLITSPVSSLTGGTPSGAALTSTNTDK